MSDLALAHMTEREFSTVFALLAIQLRLTDADELTIRSYYEALKVVPLEAVKVSATAFAREAGRKFFPTSAEWYAAAGQYHQEMLRKALQDPQRGPWRCDCGACEDTGWELFDCPGDASCGRKQVHARHTYVRVCTCRPTNRTWMRHNRFGAGA